MIPADQIICGESSSVLAGFPAECIDLIYADMVYSDLDFSWIDQCKRVLKPTGSIYVQTDYRSVAQVKLHIDDLGLIFQNWIVWCYKARPTRLRRYQRKHDDILFYTKSDNYTWNYPTQPPSEIIKEKFRTDESGKILNASPAMKEMGSDMYIRDVVCRDWWDDIPVPSGFSKWDTGKKVHKWQKPTKLMKRIIEASSNPGDVVLDPFLGSGTTAKMCVETGRRYIGIDISPEYCELSKRRVERARMPLFVEAPGDGVKPKQAKLF